MLHKLNGYNFTYWNVWSTLQKKELRIDNNTSPVPKRVAHSSKGLLTAVSDEDAGR
jgi:hypothetical protein